MATSRRFKTRPIPAIVEQPQTQIEHGYRHAITDCGMGQVKHCSEPETNCSVGSSSAHPANVGRKKAPKLGSAQLCKRQTLRDQRNQALGAAAAGSETATGAASATAFDGLLPLRVFAFL